MADHVATMELIDFTPCPPRVRPTTMFTKEEVEAIEKEAYERGRQDALNSIPPPKNQNLN